MERAMTDVRDQKLAHILVDYSMKVQPGDRVAITSGFAGEPILRELFALILERGAFPHLLIDLPDQEELMLNHAPDSLLEFVPLLHKQVFDTFDVLIKIKTYENTRMFNRVPAERQVRYQRSLAPLLRSQMERGAAGALRWMSTIYPTHAYAMDADMGFDAYKDFYFRACHADAATADPVAYWESVRADQDAIIQRIQGHDQVVVRGPDVDLKLSIKDRIWKNACGGNNLPDGEVYTGPVETSANGWVHFTYPAVYQGRMVEGVRLKFEDGKIVQATADKNEEFLLQMLDLDPGARYLGEFAIGTNYQIDTFTRSILFDEKIGGSFHLAMGAGYPETNNHNQSLIHWDMICDLRQDSEILIDGELFYRNGQFV
jgi:aminopeptidase